MYVLMHMFMHYLMVNIGEVGALFCAYTTELSIQSTVIRERVHLQYSCGYYNDDANFSCGGLGRFM